MDSPTPGLPVCQYDGGCYRKNPRHFQQFSHPKQYPVAEPEKNSGDVPVVVDATAETLPSPKTAVTAHADGDAPDSPPTKARRTEESSAEVTGGSGGDTPDTAVAAVAVRETDMASPEQLLHFLDYPPHLAALVSTSGDTSSTHDTPLPVVKVSACWDGAAEVLRRAYAGMGFCAADVQCVLTAARALKPADPLTAFPGWRLVGPLALVVRYVELMESHSSDEAALPTAAAATELRMLVGDGGSAEREVRRWRCGRFRYDPPECQTVAVRLSSAADAPADGAAAAAPAPPVVCADGVHLCYHRDDPLDEPGAVVEGTAASPKFTVVNGHGWLSAYLCAWHHSQASPEHQAAANALEDAMDALQRADPSQSPPAPKQDFDKTLKRQRDAAAAARRAACVARTYSGLGIRLPVGKATVFGYREPNIPVGVNWRNHLRDWEADFIASTTFPASGAGTAASLPPPPNRSKDYGRLADAQPFRARMADTIDAVFTCVDIANDEGDCGASLELGLNCLACILADACVGMDATAVACDKGGARSATRLDPVLWSAYRVLDCAYMLLQQPLHRHILRCHLRQLASAALPVSLEI